MEILSPAKINLFLYVTSKRPDEYHNLVTLMCCIGLYDRLTFEVGRPGVSVRCSHPDVPENASNLAWKAAELFFSRLKEKTNDRSEGVRISIEKNIPVGAGLGGGSSNAATVFSGLNYYYNDPFSKNQLMQMGRLVGADVPFLIFQKPALASGVGEILEPYEKIPRRNVVVVFPGIQVSTAEIFNNLNLRLTKCEKKLKNVLLKKQDFCIKQHLCNDLETVTLPKYPRISKVKTALYHCGAEGVLMTGSGSSVFGLYPDDQSALKAKRDMLKKHDWQVFSAEMLI